MKKLIAAAVAALTLGLTMTGCAPAAAPQITGTVEQKYVEDWVEYQVVIKAADGTLYHFEVTEGQWRTVKVGQTFNTAELDVPGEDD